MNNLIIKKMTEPAMEVDDGWDNSNDDLKIVLNCGRKPEVNIKIIFSRLVKSKIDLLMKKYQNTEWLAYLIGDVDTRYVRDIAIPQQKVTAGSVRVEEQYIGKDCIGVIHSHHSLGAFFSGTDDAYINKNHDISVVVAHNGIKSQVRWTTPCGYKLITEGSVIVESENLFDEEMFIEQIEERIEPLELKGSARFIEPDDSNEPDDDELDFDKGVKYSRLVESLKPKMELSKTDKVKQKWNRTNQAILHNNDLLKEEMLQDF